MARVINTNSPGKRRNAEMRTIAEMLRRVGGSSEVNGDAKDQAAAIVYSLRAITGTVEESAQAWEKRGYWKKAAEFEQKWWWCAFTAKSLEELIRSGAWDKMPEALLKLLPHVADIQVKTLTRKAEAWQGCYRRLMAESPR